LISGDGEEMVAIMLASVRPCVMASVVRIAGRKVVRAPVPFCLTTREWRTFEAPA
jgi:hypothetical protein